MPNQQVVINADPTLKVYDPSTLLTSKQPGCQQLQFRDNLETPSLPQLLPMNPVTTENQGTLPDCKPVISGKVQLLPEPQTPKSDFYLQICVLFALPHPARCHTEAMCKSMDCLLVINKKEQSP